jgi:hypothetical protein
MTRTLRAAVVAGAACAALIGAGSAWAAYTPKLLVKSANGKVTVTAKVGATDAATARAQIYVPQGFQVATGAAAGTTLGTVTAQASAADLNNQILTLTGTLLAIAPNAAAQQQCGVSSVAATWDLHLSAAGQTLDIPMYVVTNSGPELNLGPVKLVVCLTSPDLPNGNPLRAPFGAKLISAAFSSSAITAQTQAANGAGVWTSLWTPYTAGTGTPDLSGSVEAQARVEAAPSVKIGSVKRVRHVRTTTVRVKGKKVRRTTVSTTVTFTTTVTQGRDGAPGARVAAKVNGRSIGAKTTSSNGTVTQSFVLPKGRAAISVTATVPDRDQGPAGCQATAALGIPAFGGVSCVDATQSGGTGTATASVTAFRR